MKKILSIQSSVTLGFVGNSVAAPVLTSMGHHPLLVDTVMLAAHPGYGQKVGGVLAQPDFANVLAALDSFDALPGIATIITGYLGAEEQISPIDRTIQAWRNQVPDGLYVLDPVIGDAGTLYVSPKIADGIRAHLLPLANIVTPNRFELGVLAEQDVNCRQSATDAACALLANHSALEAVVVTGVRQLSNHQIGDLLITRDTDPLWLAATGDGKKTAKNIPGGGDLLTAVLAGHLTHGMDLCQAVRSASHAAQQVIAKSIGTRDLALLAHLSGLFD